MKIYPAEVVEINLKDMIATIKIPEDLKINTVGHVFIADTQNFLKRNEEL